MYADNRCRRICMLLTAETVIMPLNKATKKHNLSIELRIRFVYYYLSGSCDPLSLSLQTRNPLL